jgi:RHS repeat-associated protein
MNNNGAGTSTVVARHDYLPFGQELGSLTGLRTGTQGYGASDTNRQKYGLTERDDATGLDHTWWRKYENTAGRWTSPDPLAGSLADPQSFNRYAYTQNDPVNSIDPSGLNPAAPGSYFTGTIWRTWYGNADSGYKLVGISYIGSWSDGDGGGSGGVKALLNEKDAKRYEQEQLGALGRLAFTPGCREFLAKVGIGVKELIDAVRNQRPFDGTRSTISRAAAGLVDPEDPTDVRYGNVAVRSSFGSRSGTNAATGMYPGGATVANTTVYDRSDIYFRRAGINTATILHEALHSLLGETDPQLQRRFGLSSGLSNNITEELRKRDCAE